jgi:hypothetical protein
MVVDCSNLIFDNHPPAPMAKEDNILDGILTAEQKRRCLSLREDDHCLHLLHNGVRVAIFSAMSSTADEVRAEADRIYSQYNFASEKKLSAQAKLEPV